MGGTGGGILDAAVDASEVIPDAGVTPDAPVIDAPKMIDASEDVAVVPDAAPDANSPHDVAPDVVIETLPFVLGPDGTLTVWGEINFSTTNLSLGRNCTDGGEAVSYSVVALNASTATLKQSPSVGCLVVGDEILLINLQGTSTAHANVGNHETVRVASVAGATVTFTSAKLNHYGSGENDDAELGTTAADQRVMMVRVPTFAAVEVKAGATVTANAWDGVQGGVLFFRSPGVVTVSGTVSMDGKGYRGGTRPLDGYQQGIQGESYQGLGTGDQEALAGGGGGGLGEDCASFGSAGGGAGYGAPGDQGTSSCTGKGGVAYGNAALTKLYFGSGGGSGGNDDAIHDNPLGGFGGVGGGIVIIKAMSIRVTGKLSARGAAGQGDVEAGCFGGSTEECWDYSGPGGGGAGGSLYLFGNHLTLGDELVDASGGAAGLGGSTNAGIGGVGRIAARYTTAIAGTSTPAAHVAME